MTDEERQHQDLEMRVAALEEKLASMEITEDDLKGYYRVARALGGAPARMTPAALALYDTYRCHPCQRCALPQSDIPGEEVFGGF